MKDFFLYPRGSVPIARDETMIHLFPILESVRRLSRVGGICTATLVAKENAVSTYFSRKVLHNAHDIGLVAFKTETHRPHVHKRVYSLTDKGLAVVNAYYDGILWEGRGES